VAALPRRVWLVLAHIHRSRRGAGVIATLHSFRFFGLIFIVRGVVGPNLPASFATFAAYGDFATGVLAMLALLTQRVGGSGPPLRLSLL
jgi:hypothetical protein